MTNKSILDGWEEALAQEVKAMKKRPLPRKTARLKTFISSLLQAQRERDINIYKNLYREFCDHNKDGGDTTIFKDCCADELRGWNDALEHVESLILNNTANQKEE